MERTRTTLQSLYRYRQEGRAITMLTCYDYSHAVLLEEAGIDSILVGDSLAQVVLGHPHTLAAEMDTMITLTAAVRRGAPHVYLIGDMPFLSYQTGWEQAVRNAGRFLVEAGCDAVKLEVDRCHVEVVQRLVAAGIPVMAHLGYRPQTALQAERIVETRSWTHACRLLEDAQQMVEAGACLLLLECVTSEVAQVLAQRSPVPVISCGSGPHCHGQVLVLHEILSLPGAGGARFCKSYAQVGEQIRQAAAAYIREVATGRFPDEDQSYHMPAAEREKFQRRLEEVDGQVRAKNTFRTEGEDAE